MRHLILVSLRLIIAVQAKTNLEACFDAADPMLGCCEIVISDEIEEECHEKFPNNEKCDFETCYAKERGFLFSNGTVDNNTLENILEVDFAEYGNTLSILKQKCLNVDISHYGEPETCHLKHFFNCLRFFVLANCPKWSNEQGCGKVKSASEECAKMLT